MPYCKDHSECFQYRRHILRLTSCCFVPWAKKKKCHTWHCVTMSHICCVTKNQSHMTSCKEREVHGLLHQRLRQFCSNHFCRRPVHFPTREAKGAWESCHHGWVDFIWAIAAGSYAHGSSCHYDQGNSTWGMQQNFPLDLYSQGCVWGSCCNFTWASVVGAKAAGAPLPSWLGKPWKRIHAHIRLCPSPPTTHMAGAMSYPREDTPLWASLIRKSEIRTAPKSEKFWVPTCTQGKISPLILHNGLQSKHRHTTESLLSVPKGKKNPPSPLQLYYIILYY